MLGKAAPSFQSPQMMHIRGHNSFNERASLLAKALGGITDVSSILALYQGLHWSLHLSPLPHALWVVGYLLAAFLFWFLQIAFLGRSFGQWIWGLKFSQTAEETTTARGLLTCLQLILNAFKTSSPIHLLQHEVLTPLSRLRAFVVLIALAGFTSFAFNQSVLKHPFFIQAQSVTVAPYAPQMDGLEASKTWMTLPFYYTLGSWPKTFQGVPVLFSLPYRRNGPPRNFTPEVVVRLQMPNIKLTLEGPKTPEELRDQPSSTDQIQQIKECLVNPKKGFWALLSCARLRQNILARHYQQTASLSHPRFEIKWFEVENLNLPAEERPKGIYLLAQNSQMAQERYILINPQGIHQTLILERTQEPAGVNAQEILQKIVGSLRLSQDLKEGKTLINYQLSQTKLQNLERVSDPLDFVRRIAEVQALLISKISVDPKNHDAYYHLGGTAYLLVKQTLELRTHQTQIMDARLLGLLDEWASAAKPLVGNAYLYAKDISPQSPNTSRLETIWMETKKF